MSWTLQAEPIDGWRTNRPTRTRRITEDGRLRVIEQGIVVRIIETDNANAWVREPLPVNPWSVSDA